MGKVLVMEPDHQYRLVEVPPNVTYPVLKKIIGGWVGIAMRVPPEFIQRMLPNTKSTNGIIIFCDDDGYVKRLQPTCVRTTDNHVLVGPVVYARYSEYYDEDGKDERYHALDEHQLNDLIKQLKGMNWNEIVMDEMDYSKPVVMSGGEVGEA